MADKLEPHAFISYVREDAARVDRLQAILAAAGIRVWRDTADLWPGEDWRRRIRQGITRNSLAFIACFSSNSESRPVSGQNDEIHIALEQMRLRRPDQPWLIPVRFDDVEVPDLDIGGGRTLDSIQRADLIGDSWDEGAARLVAAVLRVLESQGLDRPVQAAQPVVSVHAQVAAALRNPRGDVEISNLLSAVLADLRSDLESVGSETPDALAGSNADAALFVAGRVDEYLAVLDPALEVVQTLASWVQPDQARILTRFVERLVPSDPGGAGVVILTALRWFPLLLTSYLAVLSALLQENYFSVRAVLVDAKVRDVQDGRIPFIARANPWRPVSQFELSAQFLAYKVSGAEVTRDFANLIQQGRIGKRYTPMSDFLRDVLRPRFANDVLDDVDFDELFDRAEAIMALVAVDADREIRKEGIFFDGPSYGRFTWRERNARTGGILVEIRQELEEQGDRWGPLVAGLFGGSLSRATSALDQYRADADRVRSQRF